MYTHSVGPVTKKTSLRTSSPEAPNPPHLRLVSARPRMHGVSLPAITKIFLGGLGTSTEEVIKAHFGQFGTMSDVVVMKDAMTGHSRGFGFVTFDTVEVTPSSTAPPPPPRRRPSRPLLAFCFTAGVGCGPGCRPAPHRRQDGRRQEGGPPGAGGAGRPFPRARPTLPPPPVAELPPSLAAPQAENTVAASGVKIFVGGLSSETDDADFRAYFQAFGNVVRSGPPAISAWMHPAPSVRAASAPNRAAACLPPTTAALDVRAQCGVLIEFDLRGVVHQTDASVMKDAMNGHSRGFGFCTFEHPDAIAKVLQIGQCALPPTVTTRAQDFADVSSLSR